MEKSEIAYLYQNGFTIEEIRKMDTHPLDEKSEDTTPVKVEESGKVTEVEKSDNVLDEKKNSSLDSLTEKVNQLTELVQKQNRDRFEQKPTEEKTVDDVIKEFFEKP